MQSTTGAIHYTCCDEVEEIILTNDRKEYESWVGSGKAIPMFDSTKMGEPVGLNQSVELYLFGILRDK